jgi:GH35 family endo-1,4-beta-xylanase
MRFKLRSILVPWFHRATWAARLRVFVMSLSFKERSRTSARYLGRIAPACLPLIASLCIAGEIGAESVSIPPGGEVIIDSGADAHASAGKWPNPEFMQFESVAVTNQPFARALRTRVLKQPQNLWSVEVNWFTTQPIRKGDVLLATFAARGEATMGRDARLELRVDQSEEPWDEIRTLSTGLSNGWLCFHVRCVARRDFPAWKARLSVRLGYALQTVDLADVRLINYGTNRTLRDLPSTALTYPGREPGAPWRQAALDRIEKIRKADFLVRVMDADSKPVPNAQVTLKQTRHAFPFAAAVSGEWLVRKQGADADRYRQFVEDKFDYVTVEWETCWQPWEWNNAQARDCVQWLHQRGKIVHGCHIIWPGLRWMPADCASLMNQPEAFRKRVFGHVYDKVTALKGMVAEWNAVNEPYTERIVQDVLGHEALVEIFKMAHGLDPAARLGLNDYGDIASWDTRHQEAFLAEIQYLLDHGAPMKVIGLQSHFGSSVRGPVEVLKLLDRFAAFGLPLHISELDINTTDEAMQADYTRDIFIALFSHPAVEKITQWGFWEGRHWLPAAALWRRDWSLKPNGQAYLDLVDKQWRSTVSGATSASGEFHTRGFLGQYGVRAAAAGKTATWKGAIPKSGASVTITLE